MVEAHDQLWPTIQTVLIGQPWCCLCGREKKSSKFLLREHRLLIWQVVSQVYVNNHHTGNDFSKTKPSPIHECQKCLVSKIMMGSLPFWGLKAQGCYFPVLPSSLFALTGKRSWSLFWLPPSHSSSGPQVSDLQLLLAPRYLAGPCLCKDKSLSIRRSVEKSWWW